MRIHETLFHAALLAFPPEIRARDGDEMLRTYRRRWRDHRARGRWGAARYAVRATADAVRAGIGERRRGGAGAGGPGPGAGADRIGGALRLDVKVAARALARSPGFSLAAVAVLALGIGANAAIFSAVKATLLTPPPYPEPGRIVLLDRTEAPREGGESPRATPWSYPKYRVLAGTDDLLADPVAAYAVRSFTLTGAGDAARIDAEVVTPDYFEVLEVEARPGREFEAADDAPDAEATVVLGHGLWETRFGGDPGTVGRSVTLDGRPHTVIGVAPPGFEGLSGRARLWIPVHAAADLLAPFLVSGGRAHWLQAVGRLAPGAELEALRSQMRSVGEAAEEAYPDSDPTTVRGGGARRLSEARQHGQARRSLLILSTAAGLLLAVACANLAGLLVARARRRERETAVRVALGAGRWRAARGFLVEGLLLAAAGGVAALGVAHLGVELLVSAWPERFLDGSWNLRFADLALVRVDGAVLAFSAGLALATGAAFGLVPAIRAGRDDPARGLRAGARGSVGGPGRGGGGLRDGLVAAQTALTLVLVVSAGLLLRSLGELQGVDRGIDAERLLVFEYDIPRTSRWADDAGAFHAEYLERLRALPGVEEAALGSSAPLDGHWWITGVRSAGGAAFPEGSRPFIGVHTVSDGYFRVLGIRLLRGRTFDARDREGSRPVVVLSRAAARELFPDGEALGRRVAMGIGLTPEGSEGAEVVGVVDDVLYDTPEDGVMPEAYVSIRQEDPASRVFVRTRGEPVAVLGPARAALAELDPEVPIYGARTLTELEAAATADTRTLGGLLAAFAGLALLLAATGVWAVVAHGVSRRTRELGLRIALGADPGGVVRLVLRRGVAVAVLGIAAGGAGAWAASRVFSGLLYGVSPTDPATFAAAAGFLLVVSVLAAWLPARRATRVDPMETLRAE